MDSRIREALINARNQIESFGLHFMSLKITTEYDRSLRCMSDIDALLTGEPEPCENALSVAESIESVMIRYRRLEIYTKEEAFAEVASMIESYSSQVADKRVEELRAQVEELREALVGVKSSLCDTELNMNNYNDADVRYLNDGATKAWTVADLALAATEPKP